jgi:predicted ferric reductase
MDRPELLIGMLLYVRIVKPLFLLRRPYRVAEVRKERGDTWTLVMHPDGHAGFRFRPGQFGWLTLGKSPFRITGHPFSFSSSANAPDGRIEMSIRDLGDFTSAIHKVPLGQCLPDGPWCITSQSGGYARVDRWRRRRDFDDDLIRTFADRAMNGL